MKYKRIVLELLEEIPKTISSSCDKIYTIIKKHIEKGKSR